MNNPPLPDQTTNINLSDRPTVSLVMFTYNRIEYTRETLHTLMENTHYPFDLYIVDNNSNDGTREWLETVRLEYPDRIKDIRYNSTNEGLPGPTNDFWGRVDSELIGKVDNDTLVPPGWLERLVEAHQKIPKLAVVGGYHFRPEDFDDNSVRSRLYAHHGIKILPDIHIGGCCYLMKKSIQKIFGPMKFNPALKIHGWTEYQNLLAGAGYIVGYLYPLIQLEYMDDPRSKKCLINEKYQDYTRKIWRERGINFKSTDQIIEWLHADAQRIIKQPSSKTLSFEGKNQQSNKSYYGYARPEIQAFVSPKAKKILDIGCGAGLLGKELKNRQKCYVAGIEYAPEAATKSETALDRVYMGDAVKVIPEILENSFDTIIMADFLEHIANPEEILSEVKRILIPGGRLVLSIPNVRHWSVIKDLLEGRWEYQDAGILDKTHLRFFTWQSILSLLNSAGYHIDSYSGTYLQGYDVPAEFINLSKQCGIDTSSLASEGRIYQYLIACTPKSGDELPEIDIQKQSDPQNKLTSIIILTRNQIEYTERCIESIFTHTKETFELIMVDNGSTDGTLEYLESEALRRKSEVGRRKSGVRIKIIKNSENLGFAAGNNQGIAAAKGDYVLLMNNDVVVTPGWLSRMLACAEKSPDIGMVGPVSNYVSGPQLVEGIDYDTHTLSGLIEFSNKFADTHAGQAQQILRVVGFCMLIKRTVIDKIGGMDDRYGLGNFEDDDFSLRATIAGFQSWIARDCFIHHFGNRTFIGEKVDLNKSLHKNWGIFKSKWGLPAEKPYGSPYRLSEMNNTRFDPSIHCYPLNNDSAGMKKSGKDSKTAETLYSTIHSSLNTKSSEEVIEGLVNFIASYPEFALAHNDLGVLYYTTGNKEKALQFYQKAVELDPENIVFLKNLADFYYVELGRVEDALGIYIKILEAHPEDAETLLITGHICIALEKFQDAKVFYNRVLEIEPGHQDARQFLDKLNSMEAGNPGAKAPEALYDEIQPLLNNGDPHRAIAALEGLLEKFPYFALAYNDLGVLHYHTGNKEKAQDHYERAVEMMPENINFQKNLADFYCLELGRIEEALKIYVNILTTHPQDIETLLATGKICVALEKLGDARDFYHRVLKLDPGNEDASNNLRALDKHPTANALSQAESENTFSVSSDKVEFHNLDPERFETENRTATVSFIINLDGIQNRVKECIKSVMAHTPNPHEILLIKRGATKGILKWAQQLVNDNGQYRIIECTRQAGWAESLNRAVQKASGEMIALMHNDIVVPAGWLRAFKMCINLVPNIGVVGPMSNRTEGIQQMIPSDESDRLEFESAAKAFYEQYQYRRVATRKLSDFCLAFPRELLDKIGYFDEQFISEEIVIKDFCKRAVSGGYQNLIAADTYVYHYDRHQGKKSVPTENSGRAADRKKYKEKWTGTQNPQTKAFLTVQLLARAEELSHKGQIDAAVEVLLGGIGVQPENPRFYLGLSEILLAARRFQDAKDALTEMPPADENQEMRKAQLLAYAEEGLGNYEAALAQIEQVLFMNPGHAPALNLKGILAYRNDDSPLAEKYFEQAIESDPGYGEPYTNLGMLLLETDLPQNALKFFENAFRLTPADFDIATNYHSYIGATADFIRAELLAREAAALYPNNQKIKFMLIDFLIQQGKYEIAMPEIEEAIIKFGSDNGIISAALKVREKLGPITIQKFSERAPVSVCMIIKDEEKYLARCLASVKPIVDEMIVVDTGSTDQSKDIAIAFGAKVFDYEWQNDFAEARNYSISKASGEWILILDGDEVISTKDHEHFRKIVQKTPRAPIAYSIFTRNYNKLANIVGWMPNDGKYPDDETAIGWLPSEKVRLFYGKDQIWFEGPVHELVEPVLRRNGIEIKKCSIPVHHYGRLNKEKLDRKGDIYFDIGRKKLAEMGDDLNALRELAVQATILEKNQEAFELWQRLLTLNPDPNLAAIAYVNMGTIYSRLGKFEDALDAGKKAVECDPDLKEARYNHAMAELHCGHAPLSIGILEDLLKGFPDYPPARFILSAAYCCADQKEKGLEGIRKLRDTPMGVHLDIPCLELAQSLIAAGKMEYALWVLGAAIESDIINPDLLTLFKECLNMKEEMQKRFPNLQPPQTNFQEAIFGNLPQ